MVGETSQIVERIKEFIDVGCHKFVMLQWPRVPKRSWNRRDYVLMRSFLNLASVMR